LACDHKSVTIATNILVIVFEQAVVYVSTAYCNCMVGSVILEQVYPTKYYPNYVIELVQKKSPEEIRHLTLG
jgi:hypothetical protein